MAVLSYSSSCADQKEVVGTLVVASVSCFSGFHDIPCYSPQSHITPLFLCFVERDTAANDVPDFETSHCQAMCFNPMISKTDQPLTVL